uniref:Dematin actin binding protein n=1 Tax=Hippocampus comes TaxID=109280 RepID=A0A3Q2YBE9_HIPCM
VCVALQRPQTSPGSVLSLRGGANVPGSPAAAIARVDDGVMVYKDLAALPRDKAILDIERPDLMTYELHYNYSPLEVAVSHSRSLSPGSFSPPTSPEVSPRPKFTHHELTGRPTMCVSAGASSALPAGKHLEDLIIESSKFPAAEPPDPNVPSKIETEHWPCPPSSAVFEKEKACRRSEGRQEEEEECEEDENIWGLRALHRQELNKVGRGSNIGRIILKEELDKSAAPLRRKTRSLPDRSQHAGTAPASYEYSTLQSTEFSPAEKPIYPYETLVVNHRGRNQVPPGVDRTQLERHLSREEFASVFAMMPEEFEQLSLWRRNHLKKRACLF